jgi:hypothetical protein
MSTSVTEVLEQSLDQSPLNSIVCPQGDLYSDEPPLESYQHLQQMMLRLKCLDWLWKDRSDYFSAGNLSRGEASLEAVMTDQTRVMPKAEDKKRALEMLRQSNQQLEHTAVALDKLIVMVETDLSQQRLGKKSKTTSNSSAIS